MALTVVAIREDAAPPPADERLRRLSLTLDELAATVCEHDDGALGRRPDARNWSATEIVCHLRDVEELFLMRFMTMLAMDEPKILAFSAAPADLEAWGIGGGIGHPLDPDRWAEERQYGRNDPREALAAFARRRGETLALLERLGPAEWQRGGLHPTRGRITIAEYAVALAAHDANHLAQLHRALVGRA
ncbi:MAG: hypothetical protein DME07_14415 [Candidatus Rokuibacteriota bacterium]|nr:MAG: hypothetical protein DME07_14415 [Candidatus Rokubacteria bacterium]